MPRTDPVARSAYDRQSYALKRHDLPPGITEEEYGAAHEPEEAE